MLKIDENFLVTLIEVTIVAWLMLTFMAFIFIGGFITTLLVFLLGGFTASVLIDYHNSKIYGVYQWFTVFRS